MFLSAFEIADRIIVLHEGEMVGDFENTQQNIPQIVSRFSGQMTTSKYYGTG